MKPPLVAVDLGATSGRVILADVSVDGLHHEVVHRFPNGPIDPATGLHWDTTALFGHVTHGLDLVARAGYSPASVGVDSWGVDYGLLNNGELLWEPFHYRDSRVARGVEAVHQVTDHVRLFPQNGLQFLPFNTLYQLASEDWSGEASRADALLMIPDLMGFWLSGRAVTEATNASTTGLINILTGDFDDGLVELTGAPKGVFAPMIQPGEVVGQVDARWFRGHSVELVAVGSHDTASAVVGTPLEGPECAYISCGTWGLVGLEVETPIISDAARRANFTNERGVDQRVRFLSNVMGLWMLNESVKHWRSQGLACTVESLLAQARDYDGPLATIDVADERFAAPGDMPSRILEWADENEVYIPKEPVAMVAVIVKSLARAFADAVAVAGDLNHQTVKQIHLTGGGSQNELLCQAVADCAGIPVVAGPVEATALGNVLVQARAAGLISGELEALRSLITRHVPTRRFNPRVASQGVNRDR